MCTKVAFVTGANKGIGLSIVESLRRALSSEWHVYLTARNQERGKEAVKLLNAKDLDIKFHLLDIDCEQSRHAFVQFIKATYPNGVHTFVNNAGIAYKNDSTAPFPEQVEVTFKTNYTNTLKMCQEILPCLATNATLVNVSSLVSLMTLKKLPEKEYTQMTSPMTMAECDEFMANYERLAKADELEKHNLPKTAYGMSKLGLTKATYILANQYKDDPRQLIINSCCPGYVATDMSSFKGHKTTEQGAETPCYLATLPANTDIKGKFVSEKTPLEWSKETPTIL